MEKRKSVFGCVAALAPYTKMISAVNKETNETNRIALVDEFEAYLNEELPFIPLWFSNALHVQSKTVSGIDYASSSSCNENVWEWVKAE